MNIDLVIAIKYLSLLCMLHLETNSLGGIAAKETGAAIPNLTAHKNQCLLRKRGISYFLLFHVNLN